MTENIVSVSLFYETPAARSDKYSMPIIFDGVTFDGGYEIQFFTGASAPTPIIAEGRGTSTVGLVRAIRKIPV